MSRTDHHRPYRIRVADPSSYGRYAMHGCGKLPCDLSDDPRPPRWHWVNDARARGYAGCEWVFPYHYFVHPPRDYRHVVFYGPDRRRARDWARDAARSHNSGHDIPEPPDGRTRNSATWLWW
jgi:hypothetical protein